MSAARIENTSRLLTARVESNERICREHYRLTVRLPASFEATPGQFVHIVPVERSAESYRVVDLDDQTTLADWHADCATPLLRRAFSIGGLRRSEGSVLVDIVYRVVGKGTRWMFALKTGDAISVLGPLGNDFPVSSSKSKAWLVSGGVGLPPMLWLSEALHGAGRASVAFFGAQTRDLVPLTLSDAPDPTARAATLCATEFGEWGVPCVVSTDDGSVGYKGYVGQAMAEYSESNPPATDDLVVYTCGPEVMMRFVASFCAEREIECHVCMERAMACGTGTCQSCVVPVRDAAAPDGWLYELCCTMGPVFDASRVLWDSTEAPV